MNHQIFQAEFQHRLNHLHRDNSSRLAFVVRSANQYFVMKTESASFCGELNVFSASGTATSLASEGVFETATLKGGGADGSTDDLLLEAGALPAELWPLAATRGRM